MLLTEEECSEYLEYFQGLFELIPPKTQGSSNQGSKTEQVVRLSRRSSLNPSLPTLSAEELDGDDGYNQPQKRNSLQERKGRWVTHDSSFDSKSRGEKKTGARTTVSREDSHDVSFNLADGQTSGEQAVVSKAARIRREIRLAEENAAQMSGMESNASREAQNEALRRRLHTAEMRASGERVHDDVRKLKQAEKRIRHQKRKAAARAQERERKVLRDQQKRQQARQQHLAERSRSSADKLLARRGFASKSSSRNSRK